MMDRQVSHVCQTQLFLRSIEAHQKVLTREYSPHSGRVAFPVVGAEKPQEGTGEGREGAATRSAEHFVSILPLRSNKVFTYTSEDAQRSPM